MSAAVVRALAQIVQRDPGKRGIAPLIVDGDFEQAAAVLAGSRNVVVITGFPCLIDLTPPTETDGPPGAVAIARAVVAFGGSATVVTDDSSRGPVEACAAALREARGWSEAQLAVVAFPPAAGFGAAHDTALAALVERADAVVAIERAGVAADGHYYTMRARDMTELIAPLERAFDAAKAAGKPSIGIGDGGNELGMGKVVDAVRAHVNLGSQIACVKAADLLLACGVSNWGGYGLAAASAVLRAEHAASPVADALAAALPEPEEETQVVRALVAAGARDGITRADDLSVDGMAHDTHLALIEELRRTALGQPAT